MFDGISQALLDDSVEAESDFIGSFVGRPLLRSLRSYFPVERSLLREREAPRLIPSGPIPTDTIGERCSEPSLQLAQPGLKRSRLSTGASCRVRRMSNETAEVDGHSCQKLHQLVMISRAIRRRSSRCAASNFAASCRRSRSARSLSVISRGGGPRCGPRGSALGAKTFALESTTEKQIRRITGELPFPQESDPMIALPDE